jgi:hypothetical protein
MKRREEPFSEVVRPQTANPLVTDEIEAEGPPVASQNTNN